MPSPRETELPEVTIRYIRPADRIEIFVQTLVYEDPRMKVTFAHRIEREKPLVIGGEVALEDGSDAVWFTFPGAWHDIGRFHRADGAFTGIYANIIVPYDFRASRSWETTDLFLDLWTPADPNSLEERSTGEVLLLDEDELAEAERKGWVDYATSARARDEARHLIEAAAAGRWPPAVVREWTRERALGMMGASPE